MRLIDTHQHLILRARLGYEWAEALPDLAGRDFTLADYTALTAGMDVVGSIFMETAVNDADYRAEARLIAGMIGQGGLMGQIASCRPEEDAGFEAWLDEAATLGVVGYRRVLHVVGDDLSQSDTFRRNLRRIGARGLPFDLCVLAHQHGLAEALVRACPDQVFVLDHCGNPDIAAGGFAPWAASLRRLAALPNLYVKLSGLPTNCAPGPVDADRLRPYVEHVLACFGPARMLWGGDWPVVNMGADLPSWIRLTRALLADLSPDEQARIGEGTARVVYGL